MPFEPTNQPTSCPVTIVNSHVHPSRECLQTATTDMVTPTGSANMRWKLSDKSLKDAHSVSASSHSGYAV